MLLLLKFYHKRMVFCFLYCFMHIKFIIIYFDAIITICYTNSVIYLLINLCSNWHNDISILIQCQKKRNRLKTIIRNY